MKHRFGVLIRPLIYDLRDGDFSPRFSFPWITTSSIVSPRRSVLFKVRSVLFRLIQISISYIEIPFKMRSSDWVIVLSNSVIVVPPLQFWKRIFRIKLASDFYVSSTMMYLDRKKGATREDRVYKRISARETWLLKHSNLTFFNNRSERELLEKQLSLKTNQKNLVVLPQTTPDHGTALVPPSPILRIFWWGMISPLHGVDTIIKAFRILSLLKIPFFATLFVLPRPEKEVNRVRNQVKTSALNDVVKIDTESTFANGKLLRSIQNGCDIVLGHFGDHSDKAKTIVPTKVLDGASLGLPVVTRFTTGLGEFFVDKHDIVFADLDPKEISNSIVNLYHDCDTRQKIGTNARKTWEKYFKESAAEEIVRKSFATESTI